MNASVYVDIDQGIHKVKLKVARNETQKKLHGISFSINMENFETFCLNKKLSPNLFFLKCEQSIVQSCDLHFAMCQSTNTTIVKDRF